MAKVSIIVPVYNIGDKLSKTIESIQKQTLKDIQIILVNDGSTDDSLFICERYAKHDSRIKIIDKENGGVSSARNAGIVAAKGLYIGFVDAGDWIEPEMYENLYKKVENKKIDIGMCNYLIHKNKDTKPIVLDSNFSTTITKDNIISHLIANMISPPNLNSNSTVIMGNVWRLIIKSELIERHNIQFKLGIPLMEDLIFCIEVLIKANKVIIDNNLYYNYILENNTASTSYREDMACIQTKVYEIIEDILIKENILEKLKDRMDIRYINMIISLVLNELHVMNKKNVRERIETIKQICRDEKAKKILATLDTGGYTIRKKNTLNAIRHERGVYLYLYYNILSKIKAIKAFTSIY